MKQTKAPTIHTRHEADGSTTISISCSRMFDIEPNIDTLIGIFIKAGWRVSERAIVHNFEGWQHRQRCGYRDDKNGYFLFTPSGSTLRLNASKISEFDTTYQV